MKTYRKFKNLKIDCTYLGFEQSDCKTTYFCTPKGANIIGWAGSAGIHYCFIRGFGEMVFAVSPENLPGDYVHPIAKNFKDMLRLLISCGDMAAVEQAHACDIDIFNSFLEENKPSETQSAILEELKSKLSLSPMENPFEYIKELQSQFDYSKIKYTPEYYDTDMNPNAPEEETEWKVFYDGGYWEKKGRAGKEIELNIRFNWGYELWHIPAIYSCSKGFVIDYCVEIAPEKLKVFIDKWEPSRLNENKLTSEQRRQLESENPLEVDFRAFFYLNGKEIHPKSGTSISWIPESCLPSDVENNSASKKIIKHYGLDESKAWSFHRWSCPWATTRKPTIKTLKLMLERPPVSIIGEHFENPNAGDVITFIHPVFGTEHKLTVLEYEKQEFDSKAFAHEEYEFPTYHTVMTYILEPDISGENFSVRDCLDNDNPKRRPKKPFEPQATYDACSIGIIGSADGPTALVFSKGEKSKPHAAMSALHFEPTDDVEWKMVFREKMMDDVEVTLL